MASMELLVLFGQDPHGDRQRVERSHLPYDNGGSGFISSWMQNMEERFSRHQTGLLFLKINSEDSNGDDDGSFNGSTESKKCRCFQIDVDLYAFWDVLF